MAEESKAQSVCKHCDAKYEDHSAYQARCFTGYGVGIRGLRDTSFEPAAEPAPDPQEPRKGWQPMTDLRKMSNDALVALALDYALRFGQGKTGNRARIMEAQSEILHRLAGAASSEGMKPRCPKCGNDGKDIGNALVLGIANVKCWKCATRFELKHLSDMYQFFALSPARSGEPSAPPACPECKTQLRDETAWYRCDTCHARYSSTMERGLYRLPDDRFAAPQTRLRPYFPPASQTPDFKTLNATIGDLGEIAEMLREPQHEPTGFDLSIALRLEQITQTLKSIDPLATPASTARTDGWVSVEERLPKSDDDKEYVQVCWKDEWRGRKLSTNPDDDSIASPSGIDTCFIPYFVARHYHQATHWRELPAAPGSLPQAPDSPNKPPCPNCGCNHFRGENTLCNDGVPQAEPPKEEKQ